MGWKTFLIEYKLKDSVGETLLFRAMCPVNDRGEVEGLDTEALNRHLSEIIKVVKNGSKS